MFMSGWSSLHMHVCKFVCVVVQNAKVFWVFQLTNEASGWPQKWLTDCWLLTPAADSCCRLLLPTADCCGRSLAKFRASAIRKFVCLVRKWNVAATAESRCMPHAPLQQAIGWLIDRTDTEACRKQSDFHLELSFAIFGALLFANNILFEYDFHWGGHCNLACN